MLPLVLGLIGFIAIVMVAAVRDPIGFGFLLSSNVEGVAEARLEEPTLGIPSLYLVASAVAGAGAVTSFTEDPLLARWAFGVMLASFLLITMWDLRRRRGTLAVYIRLRRVQSTDFPVLSVPPGGSILDAMLGRFQVRPFPLASFEKAGRSGLLRKPKEKVDFHLPEFLDRPREEFLARQVESMPVDRDPSAGSRDG